MRYTLQDYSDILFTGYSYNLPDNVTTIITTLTKELGVSISERNESYDNDNDNDNRGKHSHFGLKRSTSNRSGDNRYKNKIYDSWKTTPEFKATKIEKKEGVEKQMNDIRICLNKVSNKNYVQQRDAIFVLIENIIIESNDDKTTLSHIAQSIFDIANSNKFYSELYALLYRELIEKFTVFSVYIDNLINDYYDSMDLIENVDSNKDYDRYCENNKLNDKRKASSTFIVNLMIQNIISKKDVLELIVKLQDKIIGLVDIDDKIYQIDEMTENLYILVTLVAKDTNTTNGDFGEIFSTIIANIEICSKYKTKEHKSISSRAIFKYMDIKDTINL
jgi:hypothetical protein